MRTGRLLTLSAALSLATGFAWAEEPISTPCAFVGQIDHFQYLDDKSAILEISPNKRFKVTFLNTCRELKWAVFARIVARPGICLAKGDSIIVGRDRYFQERCIVDAIEALPPKVPMSATAPE